jgi:hypothetical protein
MRRSRGSLLPWPGVLSLAACVGLLLGWGRARFGEEVYARFVGDSILLFGVDGRPAVLVDGNYFNVATDSAGSYTGPSGLLSELRSGSAFGRPARSARVAGFEFYRDATPNPQYRALVIPVLWPVAMTLTVAGAMVTARLRQRRRAAAGRCAACGYDLRGTPDRCPECGTAAAAPR